jgi:hypothetical protein
MTLVARLSRLILGFRMVLARGDFGLALSRQNRFIYIVLNASIKIVKVGSGCHAPQARELTGTKCVRFKLVK